MLISPHTLQPLHMPFQTFQVYPRVHSGSKSVKFDLNLFSHYEFNACVKKGVLGVDFYHVTNSLNIYA